MFLFYFAKISNSLNFIIQTSIYGKKFSVTPLFINELILPVHSILFFYTCVCELKMIINTNVLTHIDNVYRKHKSCMKIYRKSCSISFIIDAHMLNNAT